MTDDPAGFDIAAGFDTLARFHRSRLRAGRRYMIRIAVVQGAVFALCVTLAAVGMLVAADRAEPARIAMLCCSALNAFTAALCVVNAVRAIRPALVANRFALAALQQTERHAAQYEEAKKMIEKMIDADLPRAQS